MLKFVIYFSNSIFFSQLKYWEMSGYSVADAMVGTVQGRLLCGCLQGALIHTLIFKMACILAIEE